MDSKDKVDLQLKYSVTINGVKHMNIVLIVYAVCRIQERDTGYAFISGFNEKEFVYFGASFSHLFFFFGFFFFLLFFPYIYIYKLNKNKILYLFILIFQHHRQDYALYTNRLLDSFFLLLYVLLRVPRVCLFLHHSTLLNHYNEPAQVC